MQVYTLPAISAVHVLHYDTDPVGIVISESHSEQQEIVSIYSL